MADDKLVKMTAPSGSTVRVSKERADRLRLEGYEPVKTAPAKAASSSKSEK